MSAAKQSFVPVFGAPAPSVSPALRFRDSFVQGVWERIYADTGAGWFRDRFLLLFTKSLDRLKPCLDAWSFLVPAARDRVIVGRNAYGALLVVENANDMDTQHAYVLDPFLAVYWTAPSMHLFNMIGKWLPENRIPNFLDDRVYKSWVKKRKAPLPDNVILAPKVPMGLGGKMAVSNVQEEDIVDFYKTSGPIYEKAFAKMGRAKP